MMCSPKMAQVGTAARQNTWMPKPFCATGVLMRDPKCAIALAAGGDAAATLRSSSEIGPGFSALSTDRFVDAVEASRDNRCSQMLVYLSGSIEYAADFGKSWRAEITPFLREIGHTIYDPAADEKKNLTDEEVREFRKWKVADLPGFQGVLRKIIAWD